MFLLCDDENIFISYQLVGNGINLDATAENVEYFVRHVVLFVMKGKFNRQEQELL